MPLPVLNTPAQLRRVAGLLLPASVGAPLVRSTLNLGVRRVWVDGVYSIDYDMPDKFLAEKLLHAFSELVRWQESQGLLLAPFDRKALAPRRSSNGLPWRRWKQDGRFWVSGPTQALVFQTIPTAIGPAARRMTTGEENLRETGGKIAYRVASWFYQREYLAEVRKR